MKTRNPKSPTMTPHVLSCFLLGLLGLLLVFGIGLAALHLWVAAIFDLFVLAVLIYFFPGELPEEDDAYTLHEGNSDNGKVQPDDERPAS